jgi:nitrogen fixation NifU-like protein
MAFRTDRRERLEKPDGYGKQSTECGDTIEFFLLIKEDRILASYEIRGCLNTNACANAVIELINGRTLTEAWQLSAQEVFDFLESLEPFHFHCAELAIGALHQALNHALTLRQAPWKKLYQ